MQPVPIAKLAELRGFGWSLWDPLDLEGAAPQDEYDTYLLQVVGLLRNGASEQEAEAYLRRVETDQMGLEAAPEGARAAVVSAIVRWLSAFPPGLLKFR